MGPAEKLQRIAKVSGLSQTELARRVGVSFVTLNSWIKGRSHPRRKSSEAIDALFSQLVGGGPLPLKEHEALIESAEAQSLKPARLVDDRELFDRLTIAFTYNTNTIEGSTMTVADTRAVLLEGKTVRGRTLVEQLEAKNHQTALWWLVDELCRPNFIVDEELIRELHVRLMNGIMSDAGRYRTHSVRIAGSRVTVANHLRISDQIHALCTDLHSQDHPLVASLALHHAKFERVHPFSDGNGRIGRLLMLAIALQRSVVPPIVLRERRARYYKALEVAQLDENYALLEQFLAESMLFVQSGILPEKPLVGTARPH